MTVYTVQNRNGLFRMKEAVFLYRSGVPAVHEAEQAGVFMPQGGGFSLFPLMVIHSPGIEAVSGPVAELAGGVANGGDITEYGVEHPACTHGS